MNTANEIENIFKYFGYNALSEVYHKLNKWDMIRHQDGFDQCDSVFHYDINSYFGSSYHELKIDYDTEDDTISLEERKNDEKYDESSYYFDDFNDLFSEYYKRRSYPISSPIDALKTILNKIKIEDMYDIISYMQQCTDSVNKDLKSYNYMKFKNDHDEDIHSVESLQYILYLSVYRYYKNIPIFLISIHDTSLNNEVFFNVGITDTEYYYFDRIWRSFPISYTDLLELMDISKEGYKNLFVKEKEENIKMEENNKIEDISDEEIKHGKGILFSHLLYSSDTNDLHEMRYHLIEKRQNKYETHLVSYTGTDYILSFVKHENQYEITIFMVKENDNEEVNHFHLYIDDIDDLFQILYYNPYKETLSFIIMIERLIVSSYNYDSDRRKFFKFLRKELNSEKDNKIQIPNINIRVDVVVHSDTHRTIHFCAPIGKNDNVIKSISINNENMNEQLDLIYYMHWDPK